MIAPLMDVGECGRPGCGHPIWAHPHPDDDPKCQVGHPCAAEEGCSCKRYVYSDEKIWECDGCDEKFPEEDGHTGLSGEDDRRFTCNGCYEESMPRCHRCGSRKLAAETIEYETGITSAGYRETMTAKAFKCRDCGYVEEI